MRYHPQTVAALRVYQGLQRDRFRPFSDADVRDCLEFDTAATVEAGYKLARERGLSRARRARAAMSGTGKACESYMMDLAQAQFDMARARDYRRTMLAALVPAPAMVPQPCQQQQACAAPRASQTVISPRLPQRDGISSVAVVAQTVHVECRADWYAFSSACRKAARDRVERRQGGESTFWANVSGRIFKLRVERLSFGAIQGADGKWRMRCHGSHVSLATARLSERPRRALIGDELAWAARYRANAMRDRLNSHRKAMAVKAARACLQDARELGSAFARLPA